VLHLLLYGVLAIALAGGLFTLAARFLPAGEQIAPPIRDEPPWELPPHRALSPDEIDTVRLPVALRGYRFTETDLLLDRLASELRARDQEIARLRNQAGAPIAVAPPEEPATDPVEVEVEAVEVEPLERVEVADESVADASEALEPVEVADESEADASEALEPVEVADESEADESEALEPVEVADESEADESVEVADESEALEPVEVAHEAEAHESEPLEPAAESPASWPAEPPVDQAAPVGADGGFWAVNTPPWAVQPAGEQPAGPAGPADPTGAARQRRRRRK
jgi:hypothetical protein